MQKTIKRVALVTGANRGIGFEIARQLALQKMTVLIGARHDERGLDAQKELAVAKFFATEAGARVVAAAQHVHGGMGFDRDYPLYRYFMTSKNLEFTLGGTQETLTRLGELISA